MFLFGTIIQCLNMWKTLRNNFAFFFPFLKNYVSCSLLGVKAIILIFVDIYQIDIRNLQDSKLMLGKQFSLDLF